MWKQPLFLQNLFAVFVIFSNLTINIFHGSLCHVLLNIDLLKIYDPRDVFSYKRIIFSSQSTTFQIFVQVNINKK